MVRIFKYSKIKEGNEVNCGGFRIKIFGKH